MEVSITTLESATISVPSYSFTLQQEQEHTHTHTHMKVTVKYYCAGLLLDPDLINDSKIV